MAMDMLCETCNVEMEFAGMDNGSCDDVNEIVELWRCPVCGNEECQAWAVCFEPAPEDCNYSMQTQEYGRKK